MGGEGSIYPIDKRRPNGQPYRRWIAQTSVGPRSNRSVSRKTCRTRAEAKLALEELKAERRGGASMARWPLGSYLRSWLDETAGPSISPNTLRGYEAVITHLEPIASIPLADVTAEDIEFALNRMTAKRKHQKVAQTASPKTIRNVLLMLRGALASAERRGHISKNPARLVPLPRVAKRKPETLSAQQAGAILRAVRGDRYEAAFALSLMGLRASETLGLAWDDVDAHSVHVRLQLVGSGPSATRDRLKSDTSARDVPLPGFVATLLESHRARQKVERIAAGLPTEAGLVFVTEAGYAVNGSWLTRHFNALLTSAGLPRMRLHDLRHGFSSLLAALGVHPSVQQALLGHASARTSLDIYTSVSAAQQREAMDRLGEAIG